AARQRRRRPRHGQPARRRDRGGGRQLRLPHERARHALSRLTAAKIACVRARTVARWRARQPGRDSERHMTRSRTWLAVSAASVVAALGAHADPARPDAAPALTPYIEAHTH